MNVTLREDSRIGSEPSMDALMLQVQQRDLLSFVQMYSRMLQAIKRQAASEGWQASAADDIAQEVFLRVWENPDRFDGQRSARAYLLGISRNIMREQRKAGAKTFLAVDQCLPEPATEDDPAAAMERAELMQALAAARFELSENQAAALRMVYDEGMPQRQTANQLGCSEHTIHLRLRAARHRLRQLLRGRMQLAMPGSVFCYVRRCLSDKNVSGARREPIHWAARWVAGIGAMSLSVLLPPRAEHASGYQGPEPGSSPPIARSPFSGEGAPSPAVQVELQ